MRSRSRSSHASRALLLALGVATGSARGALVRLEAESGTLGTNFLVGNGGGATYISNTNNNTAGAPGIPGRVASYTVTFPEAGAYDLYARVRIGAAAASDDSLLYANGFGIKSPTTTGDWVLCNNLWNVGYTNASDVVSGAGTVQGAVWKWINVSEFNGGAAPITFTVPAANLTQTFQIGGREDGLDLDKLAFGTATTSFTVSELDTGTNIPPVIEQRDLVNGNLVQFNDNGTWSWFQNERAVVDGAGGRIIIGSDASGAGRGGSPREGDVEVTLFDLASGMSRTYTLKDGAGDPGAFYADDHNAPGLLVLPNGNYLAVYAAHNTEKLSYWRIFDGSAWSPEQVYDWTTQPGGADFNTTYSNPYYLAAEGRIYNFSRGSFHGSPNLITSDDFGLTWTYRGILVTNQNVGYVNGYFNYWGNGLDRIDFICTEYHPADFNTSIYHGFVSNGMSFRSDGSRVDSQLYDKLAPTTPDFTVVFPANTVLPAGQTNTRCWNIDVQRYEDGTVAALFKARVNDFPSDPEHAFFYARWNGTNWASTWLARAGKRLYVSQEDYTGLAALCPNDPNVLFISTSIDPRNQTNLGVHEIFKGVTTNNGAAWSWTPITRKSVRDNLRPIVPAWDKNNRVLLWWRGNYSTAQIFDTAVVGIVERNSETLPLMSYQDASGANTSFANGLPLTTTGPSTNAGAADNQWHLRTGAGNAGSVLTSAETGAEDSPALKTTVALPGPGTYDLWVNFWGKPGADWRIKAGLVTNQMQVVRQMASKQVEAGDHSSPLTLTNTAENAYLYQAYLGRVGVTTNLAVSVFVDDEAVLTGTVGSPAGDTVRTWYDGISYSKVETFSVTTISRNPDASVTLAWSSIPADRSLSTPTYSVQRKDSLPAASWTTLASGLPSAGATTTYTDNTATTNAAAFYRIRMP